VKRTLPEGTVTLSRAASGLAFLLAFGATMLLVSKLMANLLSPMDVIFCIFLLVLCSLAASLGFKSLEGYLDSRKRIKAVLARDLGISPPRPGFRSGNMGATSWLTYRNSQVSSLMSGLFASLVLFACLGIGLSIFLGHTWAVSDLLVIEFGSLFVGFFMTDTILKSRTSPSRHPEFIAATIILILVTFLFASMLNSQGISPVHVFLPLGVGIYVAFDYSRTQRALHDFLVKSLIMEPRMFGRNLGAVPVVWVSQLADVPFGTRWTELAGLATLPQRELLVVKGLADSRSTLTLEEARALASDTYKTVLG
jgi:positive regulator of sigma E activity